MSKTVLTPSPRTEPLSTLALGVSANMLYNRLFRVSAVAPLLPLGAALAFAMIDLGAVFMLGFFGVVLYFANKRISSRHGEKLSPNPKKLLAIAVGVIFCYRAFSCWLMAKDGYLSCVLLKPSRLSSAFGIRQWVALGVVILLLELAILLQYVGHASFIRCSTIPLAPNRSAWKSFSQIFLQPSEMPGEFGAAQLKEWRRFQNPTWKHMAYQFLLKFSLALPFSIVLRLGGLEIPGFTSLETFIISLCIILFAAPMLFSSELDPREHCAPPTKSKNLLLFRYVGQPFFMAAGAVIVSYVLCTGQAKWNGTRYTSSFTWGAGLRLWVVSFLAVMWNLAFDLIVRTAMFIQLSGVKKEVESLVYDGSSLPYATTITQSLLRWSPQVASQILSKRVSAAKYMQRGQLDRQELQETMVWGKKVAESMLHVQPNDPLEAPLEEDLLQLAILLSLADEKSDALDGLDKPTKTRGPEIVTVVRALCVFLCAIVEVLNACACGKLSLPTPFTSHRSHQKPLSWLLPQGFLCATEWAVQAVARCVVKSSGIHNDWKMSPMAMLVPTCLEILHAVRIAASEYNGSGNNHGLTRIMNECDEAGRAIVNCCGEVHLPYTREWMIDGNRQKPLLFSE